MKRIYVNKNKKRDRNTGCSPRYELEHIILPKLMYSAGDPFFCDLLTRGGFAVADLYKSLEEDHNWKSPYQASDFWVDPRIYDFGTDKCLIVRIAMPKPKAPLECRSMYLCHSQKDHRSFCFTSELNELGTYFLCGWTEDGTHLNFGDNNGQDEFERVVLMAKWLVVDSGLNDLDRSVD